METVRNILEFLDFKNSLILVTIVTCLNMVYIHTKNLVFQLMVQTLGIKASLIEFKARFLTFALLYSVIYGVIYLITIFA